MSVIAIDFGNENCIIAKPGGGSVSIIRTASAARVTPTMVGIDNELRYSGESAQTHMMGNVKGTINQLKRLIGLRFDTPEREEVQGIMLPQLVRLSDGYIGVRVTYQDKELVVRIEQCVGFLLSKLFKLADSDGVATKNCVIVVSPWWTEEQRRSLIDAASIYDINVIKLLNSTTAAAIAYSMDHKDKLPAEADKAIFSIFIDFGDSSLNVAVAKLYQGSVEIKSLACNEHLGGSHFTNAFIKYLKQKVNEKYHIDVSSNPRAMIRFRDAADKLKRNFSVNPKMMFEVPNINDIDISILVKREEFESQIQHLIDQVEAPIVSALKLARITKENLEAIEIMGGGSRVAAVKARIEEIFGRKPTQSLNIDECIATGCGFQAAVLLPQYRVNLNIKDVSPHQIMIDNQELFPQFNEVPAEKNVTISINGSKDFHFNCDYGEIGVLSVNGEPSKRQEIIVKAVLTPSCLLDIAEVRTKDGKKLKFSYKPSFGLSKPEIIKMKQLDAQMAKNDEEVELVRHTKNELESFIYTLQAGLTRDFPEYFDPTKIENYKQKTEKALQWYQDNEFNALPLSSWQQKLDELKSFGEPALNNRQFRRDLPSKVDDLRDRANTYLSRLANKDDKFKHITESERNPIRQEIQQYIMSLDTKMKEINEMPAYQKPDISISDLEKPLESIDKKVTQLFMKKKPDQPKAPAATQANKEGNKKKSDPKTKPTASKPAPPPKSKATATKPKATPQARPKPPAKQKPASGPPRNRK